MDNVKHLSSGILRAGNRVENRPWSSTPESKPKGKYDPEYDVATTTQWLRKHALLLFQLSEGADGVENQSLTNLLMHVNELLLFTLGWLETQQASKPSPSHDELILAVREVYARVGSYIAQGSGKLVELGLCFEDLSNALNAL
jgi:hypothetical protein